MMSGVIPEFRRRQPLAPLLRDVVDGTSKVHLEALIDPLSLAICLRMVGSGVQEIGLSAASSSCHIALVKILSLSETIEWRMSCATEGNMP